MWSKGYAAEETKAAFARVGELATEIGNAAEAPLDAYYARWVASFLRGELGSARETAESFLREAERAARATEAGVAHRVLGLTLPLPRRFRGGAGAFANRRCEFTIPSETAKPSSASVRTPESRRPLIWLTRLGCFGDVGRARELIDEAVARAVESAHAADARQHVLHPRPCSKSSVRTLKRPGAPRKHLSR